VKIRIVGGGPAGLFFASLMARADSGTMSSSTSGSTTLSKYNLRRNGRVSHAEIQKRDPALAVAYERLHPAVERAQ